MSDRWRNLGLLLLRLAGVYLALNHGWGKLSGLAGGGGERFIASVDGMGFPVPVFFAWASALAEFAGGLLVALGLFTRVVAPVVAFNMAVAVFVRHHALEQWLAAAGLKSIDEATLRSWGSPELACMFLLVMLALALLGPGQWSLDARLRKKKA